MKIIDLVKEKMNRLILGKKLVIPSHNYNYSEEVNQIKEEIIKSIPENIEDMEKAYFIYIELGKKLFENPINAFGMDKEKEELSKKKIEKELEGNCKAIAELYVNILNDDRVGTKAELITIRKRLGSHVDAIIMIDAKEYITNLISDLSRIKTGKRVNCFAFNLKETKSIMYNQMYKNKVEKYYKNLSYLEREQIEEMDKELGYSYIPENEKNSRKRGLYTEDVFDRIKEELKNTENFKKYVLKGRENVREEDILKYKLEFFFENMDKFVTNNGDMRYLENIRYYFHTLKKFFTNEEAKRLNLYACAIKRDFSHIYSIVKLKPENKDSNGNTYFFYNEQEKQYKEITREELKQFVEANEGFRIIGEIDYINYLDTKELEL